MDGINNIPTNYLKTAKSLGVTKYSYAFEVIFPAILPNIFTGLTLGMGGAWLGVIMAEMISGDSGVGYTIWVKYTLINIPGVIVGMLIIGGLGAFSSLILKMVSKCIMHWIPTN
jgi:NitT/TauT family transport system permease protein